MYLHSLTGCAAPLWRPDGEPHIRLKPTLTLFPLRTFAAMATLPPAPMPTRAGSFRQHLREPRIKDGTGAFSQTAHHGQVTYTVTTCNTEPFSIKFIVPTTTPPSSRNLVRLQNAQSVLMAAFFWAVIYRGTGVNRTDSSQRIAIQHIVIETKEHTLGNPTPTSCQRSIVIGVCTGLSFSPCPSPHPHTNTARLDPHNTQQITQNESQFHNNPPAFDARRRLPQHPQGTQLQLAL